MTTKEAVQELKYAQAMCQFDPSTGEVVFRNTEDKLQHEAFGIAIKSLEAWNKKIEDDRKNVHGKWLHEQLIPNDITGHMHGECSICHAIRIIDNFCPNCGAEMRKRSEDGEVH